MLAPSRPCNWMSLPATRESANPMHSRLACSRRLGLARRSLGRRSPAGAFRYGARGCGGRPGRHRGGPGRGGRGGAHRTGWAPGVARRELAGQVVPGQGAGPRAQDVRHRARADPVVVARGGGRHRARIAAPAAQRRPGRPRPTAGRSPARRRGPGRCRGGAGRCHRRPSRPARPLPAVPATAGCGHGVYPGTVGIPGMLLGWLSSRPVLRLRKCSRGCTTMPRAAARCASE